MLKISFDLKFFHKLALKFFLYFVHWLLCTSSLLFYLSHMPCWDFATWLCTFLDSEMMSQIWSQDGKFSAQNAWQKVSNSSLFCDTLPQIFINKALIQFPLSCAFNAWSRSMFDAKYPSRHFATTIIVLCWFWFYLLLTKIPYQLPISFITSSLIWTCKVHVNMFPESILLIFLYYVPCCVKTFSYYLLRLPWKVGQCFFLVEPAELFRINLLTETTKFYSVFLWLLVHQILNVTYLYSSLKNISNRSMSHASINKTMYDELAFHSLSYPSWTRIDN